LPTHRLGETKNTDVKTAMASTLKMKASNENSNRETTDLHHSPPPISKKGGLN